MTNPLQRRRYQAAALLILGLAGAAVVTVLWLRSPNPERAALERLPNLERRALYERTLRTLKATCAPRRPTGLDDFCRSQAEFVLNFSECDTDCRSLSTAQRSVPSR